MKWIEPPPLPPALTEWLAELGAPPRLVAHLRLVRQTAHELLVELLHRWPALKIDEEAVLFGAATHDIGKALHLHELAESGSVHERGGRQLLEQRGVPSHLARFAETHSAWKHGAPMDLEDLLVALADTCWKGARPEELELRAASALAEHLREEVWATYAALDELLGNLAEEADARLAWQSRHGLQSTTPDP